MPALTIPQALEIARAHHQAGRLAEAEVVYRQILGVQPQHAEAAHLLGIVAAQTGRHELAIEWLHKAAALQPGNAAVHSNLGEAYRGAGRLDEAMASYRRALEIRPDYPEASNNLGIVLTNLGRPAEAIDAIRRAIASRPRYAEAHNNLGNALMDQGRAEEAIAAFRRALEIRADQAAIWNNLAGALRAHGQWEEAVTAGRRAVDLDPNLAEAHANLGKALVKLGRADEAVAVLRRQLAIDAGNADAENELGNALAQGGRIEEALAAYRRAVARKPDFPEAHYNLGNALWARGQGEEALPIFQRAVELKPDFLEAQVNAGAVLAESGRMEEATAAWRQALEIRPDSAVARSNLGNALRERGEYDAAIVECRRAVELRPDYAEAKFNLALLLLTRGDFDAGWPLYEARLEMARAVGRKFAEPKWAGEELAGRRILVHAEQGYGDSIQFIRYASRLAARGGEVIVEGPRVLQELFRSVEGVREMVATGEAQPTFDVHIPMLSLPWAFQTRREDIPNAVPYLSADPLRREEWKSRLGPRDGRRRVGLAWAGNVENPQSRYRDLPLEKLWPLLKTEGVEFHSLQVGRGAEQIRQLPAGIRIVEHASEITDFADTAAALMEMDLVISVDSAVAHLAGALGRPVWTLLPFVPDWRWGLGTEETAWYPTMRLFRQASPGDWESVVQHVTAELARDVATKAAGA